MTGEEANRYIGKPWVSGAHGSDSFDCWGLLGWVQEHYFGYVMPELPAMPDETRALYHDQLASGAWRIVPRPIHGCGVLLRDGDRPHVGVYLRHDGGGVLHATEGVGVIYTPRQHLKMLGYPRATWYEFLSRDGGSRG
jgi:cell wall-associated NlpC family hydrolase